MLMGWLVTILGSGLAHRSLGTLLAAPIIVLLLMNLRRARERSEWLAERLSTSEKSREIRSQMLDAASRCPADRNTLAERPRDGRF